MNFFRLWLLSAMAFEFSCLADVTKLPAEHRKVLQDASHFHATNAVTNLPPPLVMLCADHDGRFAR